MSQDLRGRQCDRRSSCTMKTWCALVFLWLAYLCPGALSCPELCKCYPRKGEVVCSEVSLSEYPSEAFPKNTTLMTIQFTNITSLSERQLNSTPLLQGLHLYGNHLRVLSPHLLRGLPVLNTLDLTENKLSVLPADVFSHAPLTSLVLKSNQIEKADEHWLPENSSLVWLDLSGNRLTSFPAALLRKLPKLENLDFSNNRLEVIDATSLEALTKLERLNLQDNMLTTLDAALFENANSVSYLFLSRNKLKNLPQNLFRELTQLKLLSLDDNQLSHIPEGLLDPLESLDAQGLDLTANPWVCDGNLGYLWRWLQKNKEKVFLPQSILCAEPESLVGRSVMSLTENELQS